MRPSFKMDSFREKVLDGLPWQEGYSYILAKREEFIWDAPSVPEARELLAMLQSKLKGTSLNEFVTLGRYKYMLIHDRTIVRVRDDASTIDVLKFDLS